MIFKCYTYTGELVHQSTVSISPPEKFTGFCVDQSEVAGNISWWLNGQLHNFTGPALVFDDGEEFWYVYGKCVSKEHCEILYKLCQLKGIEKIP